MGNDLCLKVSLASASAVCTDMGTNRFVELRLNAGVSQAQVVRCCSDTTRPVTDVHPTRPGGRVSEPTAVRLPPGYVSQ